MRYIQGLAVTLEDYIHLNDTYVFTVKKWNMFFVGFLCGEGHQNKIASLRYADSANNNILQDTCIDQVSYFWSWFCSSLVRTQDTPSLFPALDMVGEVGTCALHFFVPQK